MALFIRQSEDRSQLQQRVAAELQEKARKRAQESTQPDGVTDSAYLKDTKSTTSLAWVWVLIVVLAVGATVFLIISNQQ
jgi:uncharacterized protein HemX